jgi:hypothetical protein
VTSEPLIDGAEVRVIVSCSRDRMSVAVPPSAERGHGLAAASEEHDRIKVWRYSDGLLAGAELLVDSAAEWNAEVAEDFNEFWMITGRVLVLTILPIVPEFEFAFMTYEALAPRAALMRPPDVALPMTAESLDSSEPGVRNIRRRPRPQARRR